MLLKSNEGFGSGKNHVLDICTKSYANGLNAIKSPRYNFLPHQKMNSHFTTGHKTYRNWSKPRKLCAFLFNLKTDYTARWRLFATPDYLGWLLGRIKNDTDTENNQHVQLLQN